ncbi:MAG: hypothetical protein U5O16_21320 [Rhodococcus sp. (in: high G+C Gram-positive bacteria)]|uniref:hypothetical protein n=1 Tax=Rhodococcus sp. TaxID=1831 RepID=UPI002AD9A34B|nr:hypothetical protein [Rhodococcus sp. (in: high G+C Gram-positive bacteria)]
MAMNANPFDARDGSARDREEVLFDFLTEQVRAPQPQQWERLALEVGKREEAGFLALLLSNLVEQLAPHAVRPLYALATKLLGSALTPAAFKTWLHGTKVDVQRLVGHLDQALLSSA